MNSFTDTILTLLLGWLRTLLNAARDFVSSDSSTSFFAFFQEHWKLLFLVLCLAGFALDIIVYLVRWRPRPVWSKRRKRTRHQPVPLDVSYDGDPFDPDDQAYPTGEYVPGAEPAYGDYAAEPTVQYQIQSKQPMQTPPATIPYTTPYFAPEANAYQEEIPQLYTDDPTLDLNLQPSDARQQQFAFGMEPSFGSAQSEPSYQYPREHASPYAPPQYTPGVPPEESFAPRQPGLTPEELNPQTQSFAQPSPYFRPFSERGNADFAPPRNKGIGAVAKRARNLLNTDEESEAVSYRDFQPTVDVSKAFHSPVYPEKKPEGDA